MSSSENRCGIHVNGSPSIFRLQCSMFSDYATLVQPVCYSDNKYAGGGAPFWDHFR